MIAPSATPDAEAHVADIRSCLRREMGECVRGQQLAAREEDAIKPIRSRKPQRISMDGGQASGRQLSGFGNEAFNTGTIANL